MMEPTMGMMPQIGPDMMKNMMGMMPEMMKQMGMTPEAMVRMQVMIRTPIFLDAPCPIFAQAKKLQLSDEQKKQLVAIENEARAKARAVLTEKQQAELGQTGDKPMTMLQVCPMMNMMSGDEAGTGPANGPACQ